MNKPWVSVIVPVYNVDGYLRQCIDSVLDQSFQDYELILVDDGATDHSGEICDEYVNRDNRIHVYHKDNGGLSSARNEGLKHAEGEYICFLDSDDYWLSNRFLEALHGLLTERAYDVVVFQSIKYYEDTHTWEKQRASFSNDEVFLKQSYEQRLKAMVAEQQFDACAWNKAFRRELMNRCDLFFTEGIIAEDVDWAARLALTAKSIALLPETVHAYRRGRKDSITASLTLKNLEDTKGGIERCIQYPVKMNASDTLLEAYYGYVAYRYMIWMAEYAAVSDTAKKALSQDMKGHAWLLKYDINRKVSVIHKMNCVLGWGLTSTILGFYLNRKRA